MKAVINYGIEVPAEFLQTEIPSNLCKTPTTWYNGLPTYPSLDGTKAVIRICTPIRIGEGSNGWSWDNAPLTVTNDLGEEIQTLEYLETLFDTVMDLDAMNEKMQSSEYRSANIEI